MNLEPLKLDPTKPSCGALCAARAMDLRESLNDSGAEFFCPKQMVPFWGPYQVPPHDMADSLKSTKYAINSNLDALHGIQLCSFDEDRSLPR
jgi:hypothetical protein